MTRLEALLNAYLKITEIWSRMSSSETHSRTWKSAEFLERLIKQEINRQLLADEGGQQ